MPVLAKFCGIVIRILCLGALGTRLHAFYGGKEMVIDLASLRVLEDDLPEEASELVLAWVTDHHTQLLLEWGPIGTRTLPSSHLTYLESPVPHSKIPVYA